MDRRLVEVFSAGCELCEDAVALVERLACPSCEVVVRDVRAGEVAARAKALGIGAVPAVVVDGKLADCCARRGPDADELRAAGVGSRV